MAVLQPAAALPPQASIAKMAKNKCLLVPCRASGMRNKSGLGNKTFESERNVKLRFRIELKRNWERREVAASPLGTFKGFENSVGRFAAALVTAEMPLQCDAALISATPQEDFACVKAGGTTGRFTDIELLLKSFSDISVEGCLLKMDNFKMRQLRKLQGSDLSSLLENSNLVNGSFQIESEFATCSTLGGRTEPQADRHGAESDGNPSICEDWDFEQGDSHSVASREKPKTVVRSARRKERQLKRLRARRIQEKGSKASPTVSVERKKALAAERNSEHNPFTTLYHESAIPSSKYLPHIGIRDLLTAEDEVELANQVQDLVKIEKVKHKLAARLGRDPSFGEWSDALGIKLPVFRRKLWTARKAKLRMINSNLRLVVAIAKDYQGQGVPFPDLLQEGTIGLMHAVENFDASLGYRFSTYAHWGIKRAVTLAATQQSKLARLPHNAVDAIHRVKQASMSFLETHKRPGMENEIAQLARISVHRLRIIRHVLGSTRSFEGSPGRDGGINLAETVADERLGSSKASEFRNTFQVYLEEALCCLSAREKEVLRYRFGVDSGKILTLEEVGEILDITRERVRQIEQKAMVKLKNSCKTKLLRNCVQHFEP